MNTDQKIKFVVTIVSIIYGVIGILLYGVILPDTIGIFFAIMLLIAAIIMFARNLFYKSTKYADDEVEADIDEFMFLYYVISVPLFAVYYFFPIYSYFLYLAIFFVFIATFYLVIFFVNLIRSRM